MKQGMFILSGTPSTTCHLDNYILSFFHYLGSPLSYCTLIFDLMRNLYIHKAYIILFDFIEYFHHHTMRLRIQSWGKNILNNVHLSSRQVHIKFYLSCCQITLGIQGNITLYCIFFFACPSDIGNICLS